MTDSTTAARPGGQILADTLALQGVNTVFGVPGESYLAVLDGLYRHRAGIRFVTCRQEGGAAFMADAYAKLTGKPGVVMVTRGPGATNASVGVHAAFQDSVPMVVFVGQVGTDFIDREAFQEIDYRRMFGQMTKWVAQVDRADRLPEYVARAFQVASSGRMGPVVLALPEDVLVQQATVADAACHRPVRASPGAAQIEALATLLARARRPFVMLGGTGWTREACDDLRTFAEANRLPVACAFRCQDLFDNRHPNYVGDVGIGVNPKLAARLKAADLVLAIGPRLGEMTTSAYTLLEAPHPKQSLVHVHAGIEELGRVYQADLMIASGMPEIAAALRAVKVDSSAWADTPAQARAEYEAWQDEPAIYQRGCTPALNLWQVVQTLKRLLPADAILTNGAGNFATWANRFWPYAGLRTLLSTTSGSMGYGVPAAVSAAIVQPQRTVVCFAGDGDFLMNGQELATAAQHGAAPVVIVFDNGMYGTIRMHQEREYPSRVLGTELANPDFAKYGEAFGGFGARVERTAEFEPAMRAALEHARTNRRPAVVHLKVDPQAITPNATLDAIRASTAKR
ncbi:MAG: thiamine pyrophosphate-binding protein [Lautropia sp.]|nr:MAG: thiamine pyrophosphate-binding protein [Pseudomonadota bacterium]MBC6960819.1 thiamine pyrophosphate-binding protein [Lautropia sp.]MCL4703348.1 thiamine pyrophosphate-binding protein [Burkholderiaceae bacterium]MDL1908912.1 thiamine pyrophosphate-binding protein [Betaproteobacteria bacterium PRO1]